jgi:hypothetical protein
VRLLSYIIAALQTMQADIGWATLATLQFSQSLPRDAALTALLNEIVAIL